MRIEYKNYLIDLYLPLYFSFDLYNEWKTNGTFTLKAGFFILDISNLNRG